MKIVIKNRFSGEIIISGKYESVKECLEKNRSADLSGADLSGADLSYANLSDAKLSGTKLSGTNLFSADLSGTNLSHAYLSGAYLSYANLSGAYLSYANLSDAKLSYADLKEIKGYENNHDILIQLIRNNLNKFSRRQQEIASRIFALRLCWGSIRKEYRREAGKIFNILAGLGWDEYKKEWDK